MIKQRFLADVATHGMEILRDDGVYRHIRFQRPGTWCMHFDLITWPGYLCYTGDMGCFVFSRLPDMFEFFRTDRVDRGDNGNKLYINLGYWSEKLQAIDGNRSGGSATEFSEEKFNLAVRNYLTRWIRENAYLTTKDERRELWNAVVDDVINSDIDPGGDRKIISALDFSHLVNRRVGHFHFVDFLENDLTEYTYHFVWCCYALAWGIKKYDDSKAEAK